jgi:uncharacterized membrane protein YraQ (UPF0718 family)
MSSKDAFENLLYMFLSLVLEGAPYILLGAVISGIIDAYLPSRIMTRLLPRNAVAAVFTAGLLGIAFPVCECAIIPVIRRLVAKGLPVACAMTYLLSAPIINPVVALSTWSAFQAGDGASATPWLMMGSRLVMGYIIAVIVGLVITRVAPEKMLNAEVLDTVRRAQKLDAAKESGAAKTATAEPGAPADGRRLVHAMRTAQKDFVDVAVFFTIGVLIASLAKTQFVFRPGIQDNLYSLAQNAYLAPLILMALAFVLSLCSTTDAFVIASDALFTKASKLAFLVFGPMMDVKLIFLYTTVFRRRFVLFMVVALAALTWLLSLAWHQSLQPPAPK